MRHHALIWVTYETLELATLWTSTDQALQYSFANSVSFNQGTYYNFWDLTCVLVFEEAL